MANAQDPPYQIYSVAEGLASSTVYCAYQDADGYLWFGTDAGACRFDGVHFENYNTSNGLVDNEVLNIFQDSKGRIWFLSLSGRLCYRLDERFYNENNMPVLARIRPVSGINSMCEDLDGGLWFAGLATGIHHLLGDHVDFLPTMDSCSVIVPGLPRAIHVPGQQPYLVVNSTILRATKSGWRKLRCWGINKEGYPSVAPDGASLLAWAEQGIVRLSPDGDRVIATSDQMPEAHGHRIPSISTDGTIWLPGALGGVTVVRPDGNGATDIQQVLCSMNVNGTIEDEEGNRWLCTDGHGVVCIRPQQHAMVVHRISSDQREGTVTAVCAMPDGTVLFGTNAGNVYRLQGHSQQLLMSSRNPGTVRDRVRDIQVAGHGEVVLTTDNWCGSINLHTSTILDHFHGDPRSPKGFSLILAGMKSLAVGSADQVVASGFGIGELVDTLGRQMYVMRPGCWPDLQRIYAPYVDDDGPIWFETNADLHRYHRGVRTDFPELSVHFGARIMDIDALNDGTLVIASAGGGVQLVRDGKVSRSFRMADGLPSDQCHVAVVRNDTILVGTDRGLAMITQAMAASQVTTWDERSGIPSVDILDIDMVHGHFFLATPAGLIELPARQKPVRTTPPRLILQRVLVNDSIKMVDNNLSMPLGSVLKVDPHAITFGQPRLVRYAYQLDEDTTWHPQAVPRLTFGNLTAGQHTLHVRARKHDSDWSVPVSLRFMVIPPWYMTLWFRVLAFATTLAAVAGVFRLFMRRAERRQRVELERQRALNDERQRIAADMHDDLGADISHLLLLARQARVDRSGVREHLHQFDLIERHASTMLKKIDEVIWNLDPADDELLPTLEFLQRYVEDFAHENGIGFRTKAITGIGHYHFPGKQRRELFLLMKELLNNLMKHNTVHNLRFHVRVERDAFLLVLEDDGTPLPPATNERNGHGMHNMHTRLLNLRGGLAMSPIDPQGTRTTITIRFDRIQQI